MDIDQYVNTLGASIKDKGIISLLRGLLKMLGDLKAIEAWKSPQMGRWNVQVWASAVASSGEGLAAQPIATLYNNTTPGPSKRMSPYLWVGSGLWVADFTMIFPAPNYAQVEATFIDSTNTHTTLTDVVIVQAA